MGDGSFTLITQAPDADDTAAQVMSGQFLGHASVRHHPPGAFIEQTTGAGQCKGKPVFAELPQGFIDMREDGPLFVARLGGVPVSDPCNALSYENLDERADLEANLPDAKKKEC